MDESVVCCIDARAQHRGPIITDDKWRDAWRFNHVIDMADATFGLTSKQTQKCPSAYVKAELTTCADYYTYIISISWVTISPYNFCSQYFDQRRLLNFFIYLRFKLQELAFTCNRGYLFLSIASKGILLQRRYLFLLLWHVLKILTYNIGFLST